MKGWLGVAALSVIPLAAACSEDAKQGDETREVHIAVEALLNGEPLACDHLYERVGKSRSSLSLLDFKLYIHKPVLVRASEERVPILLEQDGVFQRDQLALLDLEDASGSCDTGSPQLHGELWGRVPAHDDYVALDFEVGVPEDLNHGSAETAPGPLGEPGMWWGYRRGYKHLRLDVQTSTGMGFGVHLGAADCESDAAESYQCATRNAVQVHLEADDPLERKVVLDVAKLVAEVDFESGMLAPHESSAGCFADHGTVDCKAVFARLGLGWEGDVPEGLQSVFSLVRR